IVSASVSDKVTLFVAHKADCMAGLLGEDSLAPRQVGELTFAIISERAHAVVLVSDEAILDAQRLLWERLRIVAEPGGVTALAAVLSGGYRPEPGEHLGVVVSGANTIAVDFSR
ncbi:MAG: pyridoxal-phosphate dependent enzyme, partial [Streptosporangiaceae bacterium]